MAQVEDCGAEILHHRVKVVDRRIEALLHIGRTRPRDGALKRETDGEDALDGMVLQIAGDPVPLGEHLGLSAGFSELSLDGQLLGDVADGRRHHHPLFRLQRAQTHVDREYGSIATHPHSSRPAPMRRAAGAAKKPVR